MSLSNKYIDKVKKDYSHFSKKTTDLFLKQIEFFFDYDDNIINYYNAGDKVILKTGDLIHGSRMKVNELEMYLQDGLISSEFYADFNSRKKKPFVVELWDIKEDIFLGEWIRKYTGVTIDFKNMSGEIYKSVITDFDSIKDIIKNENSFRDYIITQNQEQRFIPNDYIQNEANLAFIVEYDKNCEIINNDIFNVNFDVDILKEILPEKFYEKYMITRKFDNYETGREKAIIFGIPRKMIKGVIVSRNIEKDEESLDLIKKNFPICYICNIDGIVINN